MEIKFNNFDTFNNCNNFKYSLDNFSFKNYFENGKVLSNDKFSSNNITEFNNEINSKFDFFDQFSNKFLTMKELNLVDNFLDKNEGANSAFSVSEQILFGKDFNDFSNMYSNGHKRPMSRDTRTNSYRSQNRFNASPNSARKIKERNRRAKETLKKNNPKINKTKLISLVLGLAAVINLATGIKGEHDQKAFIKDLNNKKQSLSLEDLNELETISPTIDFKDAQDKGIKGDLNCLLHNFDAKTEDKNVFRTMALLIPILKGDTDLDVTDIDYIEAKEHAIENFPDFEKNIMDDILNNKYGKALRDTKNTNGEFDLTTEKVENIDGIPEFKSYIALKGDPTNTVDFLLPSHLKDAFNDVNIGYSAYYKWKELKEKEANSNMDLLVDEQEVMKNCENQVIKSLFHLNDYSFKLENSKIERRSLNLGYEVEFDSLENIIKSSSRRVLNLERNRQEKELADNDLEENLEQEDLEQEQEEQEEKKNTRKFAINDIDDDYFSR